MFSGIPTQQGQGTAAAATPELFNSMFNLGLRRLIPERGGTSDAAPDAVEQVFGEEVAFFKTLQFLVNDETRSNLIAAIAHACSQTENEPEHLLLIRWLWQSYKESRMNAPTGELSQIADRLGTDSALCSEVQQWYATYTEISNTEWRRSALTLAASFVGLLGCGLAAMSDGRSNNPGMREAYGDTPAMVALLLGCSLLVWCRLQRPKKTPAEMELGLVMAAATGLKEIIDD